MVLYKTDLTGATRRPVVLGAIEPVDRRHIGGLAQAAHAALT